jgi:murein DD-endopeptidase MepM/ murein hydrolase activator NlpD
MMSWKQIKFFLLIFIVLSANLTFADDTSTDSIQTKINERNNQIKQLQAEIDSYNNEVLNLGTQKNSLQNTLKSLDLTQKKVGADLNLTQTKISKTSLTIEDLNNQIVETNDHIDLNKEAVARALKNMETLENRTLVEIILSKDNIGDIWADIDNNRQIQEIIRDKTKELSILEKDMENRQSTLLGQKKSLLSLKQDLEDKKQLVLSNKQTQTNLLTQTKNKETEYKKIIDTKKTQMEAYEKELFEYESQLNLITNPNQIPGAHNGMVNWPLDTIKITQLFGVTNASARLYVSGSHNGVDFKAAIGTPVKAALDGIVVGTGNTDVFPGCYSFGRWVMIKHNNGLSTIYAHLSVIKANIGQTVSTGDIIGLSGYSGYVDPPGPLGAHVHLGVYATAGVRIEQFVNSRGCKQAIVPIADVRAYLDPMLYLPVLNN